MSNPYDADHLYSGNNYVGGYTDYTSSITPKFNKSPPQPPSSGSKYPQYVQDIYSYLDKNIMGGDTNNTQLVPPPPVSGYNNNSTIIADLTKKLEDFQQKNTYFMFFIVVLIFYVIFKPFDNGYHGGHMGYHGGYMGGGVPMYPMAQPVYQVPMMQPIMTQPIITQPMMAQQPMQK